MLQAGEAKAAPADHALRLSLLRGLVRRPRWLAGTGLGLAGWALQALALTWAPLTVVQPLLGTSLVFLLALSVWRLAEKVHVAEIAGVAAVSLGVPLLALTAPDRDVHHAAGPRLALALGIVGMAALAPLGLRGRARSASILVPIGAGFAYAWDSLATKLASDDYSSHVWLGLACWFVAMNAASALGTLGEMSALQRRPVVQVAPLVFALTSLVPVALAPLLVGERWPSSAGRVAVLVLALLLTSGGAVTLARSRAVGRLLAAEARSSWSETPRRPPADSSRVSASSEARPGEVVTSTSTSIPARSFRR